MAKSLAQLKEQIARLQREADAIQATVIARIRRDIEAHGLTAEHLFGSGPVKPGSKAAAAKPMSTSAKRASMTGKKPVKYADGQGNTWQGIGKRPGWVRDALASGQTLEQLLVAPSAKHGTQLAKATARPTADASKKLGARGGSESAKRAGSTRKSARATAASAESKRVRAKNASSSVKPIVGSAAKKPRTARKTVASLGKDKHGDQTEST